MITIYNRYIYKNSLPHHMRGWSYSNIPIGGSAGTSWAKQPAQLPYDLTDMKNAGANCIKVYYDQFNASEYDIALNACAAAGIDVIMIYYVPHNTDYSVATGGTNRSSVVSTVQAMITNLSSYSAIVGWGIGNEVNYELGGTSLSEWYTLLEASVQAGKAIDTSRFHMTSNGDIASIQSTGDRLCPSLDVWGATLYRGRTFSGVRDSIIAATNKPFIITEYGFDAYDSSVSAEDQAGQASRSLALTQEAESYYPYITGYFIFQWADQWFKMGNNSVHDTTGNALGADDRDGISNEEWYGSCEALSAGSGQSRMKRTIYTTISTYWSQTPLPNSLSKRLPVV